MRHALAAMGDWADWAADIKGRAGSSAPPLTRCRSRDDWPHEIIPSLGCPEPVSFISAPAIDMERGSGADTPAIRAAQYSLGKLARGGRRDRRKATAGFGRTRGDHFSG